MHGGSVGTIPALPSAREVRIDCRLWRGGAHGCGLCNARIRARGTSSGRATICVAGYPERAMNAGRFRFSSTLGFSERLAVKESFCFCSCRGGWPDEPAQRSTAKPTFAAHRYRRSTMPGDRPDTPSRSWGLVGFNFPLAHGVGPDRHLRARCGSCDRIVVFDPTPWISQHLGGLPLAHFACRLRCTCGARHATLEIWTGPPPTGPRDWSIYAVR